MTTVLLWSESADRSVLDGLAADHVIVTDDCSGPAAREALLRSFAQARGPSPTSLGEDVLLVGVRRGATAAVSLLLHQRRLGLRLGHVICVDTSWGAVDPISRRPLPSPGPIVPPTRIDLIGDDPATRDRVAQWIALDWDARHHPVGTTIASIVGA